ncbi:acetate/propionate family kinase [Thiococcus pfennigii]|uniref:acetate/propionate family kinase n=1 Tax=Thiococcus pfennigii TaxID=1057 RepID=UPI001908C8B3|nr:acetate kinase [Thiococcus pfennigii]MBK1699461.1 acetate kinase [Thiococcus pfennigii]
MKILVLNSGSSSIKYQLFDSEDWPSLASGAVSRIGERVGDLSCRWTDAEGVDHRRDDNLAIPDHHAAIGHIMESLRESGALIDPAELGAIGHRVVHGGEVFHSPTIVDEEVLGVIEAMIPLAPLHNPAHLAGIAVARELCPDVPSVIVFDTAFHLTMPRTAYRYALPEYLYKEHRVRRYGFHGTSHHYVAKRAAALLDRPLRDCNLITLHLGNGASATAIRNGRSVDTSMGLTPLEGLVMGTRSGDLDPAILFYLSKNLGLDNDTLDQLLNRQSGLLGLAGVNDMREIHRLAEAGDDRAELAIGVFCHRLIKYIGAYYAVLGQVDAIVFTGGIGEHDALIRSRACGHLENLGIHLDAAANEAALGEQDISTPDSPVKVLVIPTNEELEIAQQVYDTVT